MAENDLTELRYQETMKAIDRWVRDQGRDSISVAEARGIAKAFLAQASMAIVSTLPGCDGSDGLLLTRYFFEAIDKFAEENVDDY